jgi:chaperone required for assembly of F1-ATPase
MAKRFYDMARCVASDDGYGVQLDTFDLKTPAKTLMRVPTPALAELVASEWNEQGDKIEPATMPVTRLVSTAIDRVSLDPAATAEAFAAFGMSDLLFYRASHPDRLVARQSESWDPLLAWASQRFDMTFLTTESILPIQQAAGNLQKFVALASGHVLRLTGLAHAAALMGSAIIALALDEAHVSAAQAYELAFLDDQFQIEEWGEDEEARDRLDKIKLEIKMLAVYLSALKSA